MNFWGLCCCAIVLASLRDAVLSCYGAVVLASLRDVVLSCGRAVGHQRLTVGSEEKHSIGSYDLTTARNDDRTNLYSGD